MQYRYAVSLLFFIWSLQFTNMVNKWCAPGCRSGYVTQNGDEQIKLSFFKFPTDQELRKKWIHKVPRRGWMPASNTVLCEKHFRSEDFQSERIDKTCGRADKRGQLQRKFLKSSEKLKLAIKFEKSSIAMRNGTKRSPSGYRPSWLTLLQRKKKSGLKKQQIYMVGCYHINKYD